MMGFFLAVLFAPFAHAADDALAKSRALVALAEERERAGAHNDALLDYTNAINMGALPRAEKSRTLFARGLVLDQTGKLEAAAGDYSAALALAPGFAPALNNRANVWRRMGRLNDAKRDYLASLAAGNPDMEYSYYGLGQIAEAEHHLEQARGFYTRAAAANPNYALPAERLAALDEREVIQLHPPGQKADGEKPITLRPPGSPRPAASKPAPRSTAFKPAPRTAPIKTAKGSPGLRPALVEQPTKSTTAKVPAQGSGGLVQLGAWRSHADAMEGWAKANRQAPGVLEGLHPLIVTADLPQGRWFRLRIEAAAPRAVCQALEDKGVTCFVPRD